MKLKTLRRETTGDINNLKELTSTSTPKGGRVGLRERGIYLLTTLPIRAHRFILHKQTFQSTRVLLAQAGISRHFVYSIWMGPTEAPKPLLMWCSVQHPHAFNCHRGAFPTISHNRIRDLTAQLFTEVCPSVEVEPHLQSLSRETFPHRTTNLEDNARLDVKALGFWGNERQCAFFDVRVFNPFAPSHANQTIQSTYRKKEKTCYYCKSPTR